MDRDTLHSILEKHKLWLEDKEGGVKADLRGADLRRANLQVANLRGADLQDANLRGTDLQVAPPGS